MFGFINDLEKRGRSLNKNGVTDLKEPKLAGQLKLRAL